MICDGDELTALISKYVNGKKADRNRAILKEYYTHGFTYEELGERFNMSDVQIGRIIRKYGDPILLMMSK